MALFFINTKQFYYDDHFIYQKQLYIIMLIILFQMIYSRSGHTIRNCRLNFLGRALINTQIIKKYQQELQKANPDGINRYPKTFQQKMMILNNPKTIHYLEVVQYGVQYKKGKNWLPVALIALGLLGYIFTKILPIRVNERYFMICPQSPQYLGGYVFAGFNYQKPFYLYIPLMFGVYQLSRFINLGHMALLLAVNCIVGDILGQHLVNKRVAEYQVWQNQKISFGEGNMLSILYAFWSYIGFKDAFTHLKSKIFLKTVKGQGIVRRGLPFGYLCVIYGLLEIFFYRKGVKNSQVILAQVCTGIFMGLVLRKFKPLLK